VKAFIGRIVEQSISYEMTERI